MGVIIGTNGKDSYFGGGNRLTQEDFLYQTLGGEDILSAGFGSDTLEGGADNDKFTVRRGAIYHERIDGKLTALWAEDENPDIYDGGEGIDTISLTIDSLEEAQFGLRPYVINLSTGTSNLGSQFIDIENIFGSHAEDTLTGSEASNSIWGRLGDDEVFGGGGNDTLEGEEGRDSLSGGNGDDLIYGGEEADHLFGGAGNDNLSGTSNVGGLFDFDGDNPYAGDTVFGGAGDDRLTSYTERDVLHGDEGDDVFFLSFNRSDNEGATYQIFGGAGYDEITGFFSADEIDWDQGVVTFVSPGVEHTFTFEGIERIDGEENPGIGPDPDDCVEIMGDNDHNTFVAAIDAECFFGGNGDDKVVYKASTEAVTIDMRSAEGTGGLAEGDTYTSIEHFVGTKFDDILQGDDQRSLFDGGGGADYLKGGGGTDILKGQGGNDELIGDEGLDSLYGGRGEDSLFGGIEYDILKGGGKHDELYGGDGADELFGGGGSDRLEGGAGIDLLYGGNGQDRIVITDVGEAAIGGRGGDTIDFSEMTQKVTLLGKGAGTWLGSGPDGTIKHKSIENIVGSELDDGFMGTKGDDRIRGEGGDDRIIGGQGKNVLDGGAGKDTFLLGMGKKDIVFGGGETDLFVVANPGALAANGRDPDDATDQRVILNDFSTSGIGADHLSLRAFNRNRTVDDLLREMDKDAEWAQIVVSGGLGGSAVSVQFKGLSPTELINAYKDDNNIITATNDLLLGEFF